MFWENDNIWGKTIFGERVYLGNECIWGKSVLRKKGGGLDYFNYAQNDKDSLDTPQKTSLLWRSSRAG